MKKAIILGAILGVGMATCAMADTMAPAAMPSATTDNAMAPAMTKKMAPKKKTAHKAKAMKKGAMMKKDSMMEKDSMMKKDDGASASMSPTTK
jgi:hypothetical protein